MNPTPQPPIVSSDEWLRARRELLEREKAFTRARDELTAARQALPWVRVEQPYLFTTPRGPRSLAQLFGSRQQLIVYHFMFAPDWAAGCKSCSFWADSFDGVVTHLAQRDVAFVAVSRAPLAQLQAYAQRMGWTFDWASSQGCSFNVDFGVSFTPEALASGAATYNFGTQRATLAELPGFSVFARDPKGTVYRTYSCYARGLDPFNVAYQLLDLVPKGRDEAGLAFPMAWVRRHDEYGQG